MSAFSLLSNNLISWAIQITVIAGVGASLPQLFRIRHPRSQLAFLHLVLALCMLLPLVEPWQHPLLFARESASNMAHAASGNSWISYLSWIVVTGILIRLGWLAAGLWQVRRFRASAKTLGLIPDSIRQARMLTRTDSRFGISKKVDGPATLGHVDPIVLLPESFHSLDHRAQLSIVCHELIHVRRNDWLITLFEEIIGALLWFSPSVWLLLSQIKLCREQLVDGEVVAVTAATEPYIHALLAMSGVPQRLGAVPAAFFLTDGHLHRRVRSLLTGRRRSIGGLAVSYSLIGFLLLVFTAGVVIWFPLIGEARIHSVLKQEQLLPRILIARGQAFPSEKGPVQNFELRVAEPAVRSGNVMYRMDDADAGAEAEVQTMPLPEILHAPPMLFEYGRSTSQGIRMVRPGQIATPEELAGLQELFGEGAQIEVRQATDGTIQRLTILRRRSSDESSTDFPGIGIGPAGVVSAGAAIRSDVEH